MLATLLQIGFTTGRNTPFLVANDGAVVSFFKILFVLLAFLYLIFAFVVTRQIKVMRTTVVTTFSPIVRLVGYVHFVMALLVFLFFLLFL